MKPELPPKNRYWIQDGDTLRPPTDEEYAEYLTLIIGNEGIVIISDEQETPEPLQPPTNEA